MAVPVPGVAWGLGRSKGRQVWQGPARASFGDVLSIDVAKRRQLPALGSFKSRHVCESGGCMWHIPRKFFNIA